MTFIHVMALDEGLPSRRILNSQFSILNSQFSVPPLHPGPSTALKIGGEGTDVPCAASTGGWMVMRVKSNYAVAGTAVYPSSASCLTR